jgi:hypothetical protein
LSAALIRRSAPSEGLAIRGIAAASFATGGGFCNCRVLSDALAGSARKSAAAANVTILHTDDMSLAIGRKPSARPVLRGNRFRLHAFDTTFEMVMEVFPSCRRHPLLK